MTSMKLAPKDGTHILGLYGGEWIPVFWSDDRS